MQVSKHFGDWNYSRLLLLKDAHQADPKVIIRGIAMLIISLTFLCIGKKILQILLLHDNCTYISKFSFHQSVTSRSREFPFPGIVLVF